ncbi:hypothetical protein BA895_19885 [Humibacillus sp. DSM 29435]|nr:hypothetical protein BA895_19885 [Humibacillus sp. DSM 29435]
MVVAPADGRTIAAVQGLRADNAIMETVLVPGEIYRRDGARKFRSGAHGYIDRVGRYREGLRCAVDDPEPVAGSALRVDWLNSSVLPL